MGRLQSRITYGTRQSTQPRRPLHILIFRPEKDMQLKYNLPTYSENNPCPACHKGQLRLKLCRVNQYSRCITSNGLERGQQGHLKFWLGCSRYPQCKFHVSYRRTSQPSWPRVRQIAKQFRINPIEKPLYIGVK